MEDFIFIHAFSTVTCYAHQKYYEKPTIKEVILTLDNLYHIKNWSSDDDIYNGSRNYSEVYARTYLCYEENR